MKVNKTLVIAPPLPRTLFNCFYLILLLLEISDEHLHYKEKICRELLVLCTKLQMNFSLVKGQIMYELYRCLQEKITRINNKIINYENKVCLL